MIIRVFATAFLCLLSLQLFAGITPEKFRQKYCGENQSETTKNTLSAVFNILPEQVLLNPSDLITAYRSRRFFKSCHQISENLTAVHQFNPEGGAGLAFNDPSGSVNDYNARTRGAVHPPVDFEILSYFPNLVSLRLTSNLLLTVEDLYFISKLTKLRRIVIAHKHTEPGQVITDLKFLEPIKKLRSLKIPRNGLTKGQIKNLVPIKYHTRMEHLEISDQGIESLIDVMAMGNLKSLVLSGNVKIKNLDGVQYLLGLQELVIGCKSCIENNTQECREQCSNPNLTDVSYLANLHNLKSLHILNATELRDISSLANLYNLEELFLNDNKITDISVIDNFNNIRILNLPNLKINGELNLEHLSNLGYLSIRNSGVTSVRLNIDQVNTSNSDLFFYADGSSLKELPLSKKPINYFSLNIRGAQLKGEINLSDPKYKVAEIITIDLSENEIEKITGFPPSYMYADIDLSSNRLTEFPWKEFENLGVGSIDLSHNQLTDFDLDFEFGRLGVLNLEGNKIENFNYEDFPNLGELKL